MAKMVLVSQFITINSVDYSSWVKKCELAIDVDAKDVTNYASNGWKEVIGGLKSGTMAIEFNQDFATTVDANLWPLLGTVTTFETRATQSARSATNPAYTGSVLVAKYNPLSGGVGDVATVSVSWPTTGAVTRATS